MTENGLLFLERSLGRLFLEHLFKSLYDVGSLLYYISDRGNGAVVTNDGRSHGKEINVSVCFDYKEGKYLT